MKVISDIHLSPGEEYTGDLHGPLILNGDTFNILPYGLARWRTAAGIRTVNSLTDCLDDDAVFVLGNHEGRLAWLQELIPDFKVVRYYDFITLKGTNDSEGYPAYTPYRAIHGHQFAGDWTILRHFAPDLVEWFTSNPVTRQAFWAFCQRQGWMGTGMHTSNDKYVPFVGSVWAWALKEANRTHRHFLIGHTHQPARLQPEGFFGLIDAGANHLTEIT